jgi:hypothetical protein
MGLFDLPYVVPPMAGPPMLAALPKAQNNVTATGIPAVRTPPLSSAAEMMNALTATAQGYYQNQLANLNAQLVGQRVGLMPQLTDMVKRITGGIGAGAPQQSAFGSLVPAMPSTGGAGTGGGRDVDADLALVRKHESGNSYTKGYGGADLSKAPLDETGFPIWSGKEGPQGLSHAAGAYQFEPATWKKYASAAGVSDFSPESQDKVARVAHANEGLAPWLPYNPALAKAVAQSSPSGSQPGAASPVQLASATAPAAGGAPASPSYAPGSLAPSIDPLQLAGAGAMSQIVGMPDVFKPLETYYYNSPQYKAAVAGAEARGKLPYTPQNLRAGSTTGFYDANGKFNPGFTAPLFEASAGGVVNPAANTFARTPGFAGGVGAVAKERAGGAAAFEPQSVLLPGGGEAVASRAQVLGAGAPVQTKLSPEEQARQHAAGEAQYQPQTYIGADGRTYMLPRSQMMASGAPVPTALAPGEVAQSQAQGRATYEPQEVLLPGGAKGVVSRAQALGSGVPVQTELTPEEVARQKAAGTAQYTGQTVLGPDGRLYLQPLSKALGSGAATALSPGETALAQQQGHNAANYGPLLGNPTNALQLPQAGAPGTPAPAAPPAEAVPNTPPGPQPVGSPANPLKSALGGTIPPVTEQVIPPSADQLKAAIPEWQKTISQWTEGIQPARQAEMRLTTIANAFKLTESGAFATHKAELAAALKALGIDPSLAGSTDPAAVQLALHENILTTLPLLKAATPRPSQVEFVTTSENREHPNLQPEANLNMLAEDIALMRQARALPADWRQAQLLGWQNPQAFESAWSDRNPLDKTLAQVKAEIGPLKGMPGGPGSAAAPSPAPPAAATPTAVGPNGHRIILENGKWVDFQTRKPVTAQ